MKHIKVISVSKKSVPKKAATGIPIIDYVLCVINNGNGWDDPDCTTPLKCDKGILSC